jgi:hypothetical protein
MSVLVAHHLNKGHGGKSNFHGLRGSSAIGAWADGRISITKQTEKVDAIRRIDVEHRDAPPPFPIGFKIESFMPPGAENDVHSFKLEPHDVGEKNQRIDKITIEQVMHCVTQYSGITRSEGAIKTGLQRSKFNSCFDYLKNQGKVRLDNGKMYLHR